MSVRRELDKIHSLLQNRMGPVLPGSLSDVLFNKVLQVDISSSCPAGIPSQIACGEGNDHPTRVLGNGGSGES
jgi:hypothetical protein